MDIKILSAIEKKLTKVRPDIKVGDTVKLYMKIKEGNKERIQVFSGLVMALKGNGLNKSVTVRKISGGVGVERIVPLQSPLLDKVEVIKRGKVRKSKIYYMRERVGKRALRIGKLKDVFLTDEEQAAPVEETTEAPVE